MNIEDIKQFKEMKLYCENNDNMSDGIFFALAEDLHGWDVDVWAWYAEAQNK